MARLFSALGFALGAGAYLALFVLDHVESFQTSPTAFACFFAVPATALAVFVVRRLA